jgi:hypothetical protein
MPLWPLGGPRLPWIGNVFLAQDERLTWSLHKPGAGKGFLGLVVPPSSGSGRFQQALGLQYVSTISKLDRFTYGWQHHDDDPSLGGCGDRCWPPIQPCGLGRRARGGT